MAPAIVAASSLMKIKPLTLETKGFESITFDDLFSSQWYPLMKETREARGLVYTTYYRAGDTAYKASEVWFADGKSEMKHFATIDYARTFHGFKAIPARSLAPDSEWIKRVPWPSSSN